ncbi:hypothetical protein BaRGS_00031060 [Batillaria attramentaria]|uniref:Uncharacterized protein n=1 Tax=Batillaria attramentaria TaxID=370345 RepID=A0ABD0JSE1_9CAEN
MFFWGLKHVSQRTGSHDSATFLKDSAIFVGGVNNFPSGIGSHGSSMFPKDSTMFFRGLKPCSLRSRKPVTFFKASEAEAVHGDGNQHADWSTRHTLTKSHALRSLDTTTVDVQNQPFFIQVCMKASQARERHPR